jgi:glycosyltransferase involved in cell wall biosynthesis
MVVSPAVIRVIEWFGWFVYRRAALIAVVTPPMVDYLVGKGIARERLDILPDWADERIHRPAARDGDLAARLGMAGRFNVVFAGQLGIVQKLDTVIAAADLLRERSDIQFVLVGDGVERERLTREVEGRGLGNVRFLSIMPPAEMPKIYALADALLVHLSGHQVFRLTIPGKVYTYMASAQSLPPLTGSPRILSSRPELVSPVRRRTRRLWPTRFSGWPPYRLLSGRRWAVARGKRF